MNSMQVMEMMEMMTMMMVDDTILHFDDDGGGYHTTFRELLSRAAFF